MDILALIGEVGAPIAGALVMGFFIFLVLKQILDGVVDDIKTLLNGLKLVGDFMDKTILKPNNINFPISRSQFVNSLK